MKKAIRCNPEWIVKDANVIFEMNYAFITEATFGNGTFGPFPQNYKCIIKNNILLLFSIFLIF